MNSLERKFCIALALTGAALSLYFTVQMLVAAFGEIEPLIPIAAGIFFQLVMYYLNYTKARTWLDHGLVLIIYALSIAASFTFMNNTINDTLQKAQYEYAAATKQTQRVALETSTTYTTAQDAYAQATEQLKQIDANLTLRRKVVGGHFKDYYRDRTDNGADSLDVMIEGRRSALELLSEARQDLQDATTESVESASEPLRDSPLFHAVNEAARTAILVVIALILDGGTLTLISKLRHSESVKQSSESATARAKPQDEVLVFQDEAVSETVMQQSDTSEAVSETPTDPLESLIHKLQRGAYGAQPSVRGVANATGLSVRAVGKFFKVLEQRNIIKMENKRWVIVE
jgi:hypothetical protein